MKQEITIDDFLKLDIRIGTVLEASVPKWSHWVIKLVVDFGDEIGKKTIFTGMLGHHEPEEFVGNQFPFVINLKPKRIGPPDENGEYDYSQGMMMAASIEAEREEDQKPVLFSLKEAVPNGTLVR